MFRQRQPSPEPEVEVKDGRNTFVSVYFLLFIGLFGAIVSMANRNNVLTFNRGKGEEAYGIAAVIFGASIFTNIVTHFRCETSEQRKFNLILTSVNVMEFINFVVLKLHLSPGTQDRRNALPVEFTRYLEFAYGPVVVLVLCSKLSPRSHDLLGASLAWLTMVGLGLTSMLVHGVFAKVIIAIAFLAFYYYSYVLYKVLDEAQLAEQPAMSPGAIAFLKWQLLITNHAFNLIYALQLQRVINNATVEALYPFASIIFKYPLTAVLSSFPVNFRKLKAKER
jgi:hypothetical protein